MVPHPLEEGVLQRLGGGEAQVGVVAEQLLTLALALALALTLPLALTLTWVAVRRRLGS